MDGRIKDINYVTVLGWMVTRLGLSGHELMLYALIHGYSQNGESVFDGSLTYAQEWLQTSRQTVINTIKSLLEKNLITKTVICKEGVKRCQYYTNESRLPAFQSERSKNLTSQTNSINESLPSEDRSKKSTSQTNGGQKNGPEAVKKLDQGGQKIRPNIDKDMDRDNDSLNFSTPSSAQSQPASPEAGGDEVSKKLKELFPNGADFLDSSFSASILEEAKKKGLDERACAAYVGWVWSYTLKKKPLSVTKYFRKAVLNGDTMLDFANSPEGKKALSEASKIFVCPVCGAKVRLWLRCERCGLDWNDRCDPDKIAEEKRIYALPKAERENLRLRLKKIDDEFSDLSFSDKSGRLDEFKRLRDAALRDYGVLALSAPA